MSATTAQTTGMDGVLGALDPSALGARVRSGTSLHSEILDFLIDEALLLDHNKLDDWYDLLADDLTYRMPVRRSVYSKQGLGFDPTMAHFDDDHATMTVRIKRFHSLSNYAEDPPSRVRRFVSNVTVHELEATDEYAVGSYLLLLRSRWDASSFDLIPAERRDVLRRDGESFKIASRIIYPDQSVLGTPNLAIFL
jgi:3-phenylpropionate/cinnamic acid dioxygenase small subunit